MAAIGPGWATAAWIEASWIAAAWGEAAAAVTGGYTPYSVYDPRQEKRTRDKRRKLTREREKLRADLTLLVSGKPLEAPEPRIAAPAQKQPRSAPVAAPGRTAEARAAANEAVLHAAAITARQARLEVIQNELLALETEFRGVVDNAARRIAEENELIMILLLAS